jgi:excinuclease ABC subunit A
MTVVTGVSGSGKSTLINDILYRSLAQTIYGSREEPGAHESLTGAEQIDKVVRIDQSPIGRTPRSNPATYTQVFSPIRDLFAMLPEARERGYKAGRFSFNVSGGRCESCQGDGQRRIEMNFMPDVYVQCEVCNGRRYNQETLAVKFHGHSIADILDLTIEDALPVLADVPQVRQKLQTLADVGLGYVHLGQSATTLSGGEAQRMKLARELSKRQTGRTLYLLDEPTTGLHFDDVRKLLEVLHRLVDLGNSVIIIEHNLDVIRNADWILDLGPEGGEDGGRLVGQGRPAKIAATPGSYTGQFLTRYYASTDGQLAPIDPDDLGNDCHPERGRLGDRVEGPAVTGAPDLGAPEPALSLPKGLVRRGGEPADSTSPPEIAKPKRARRATPAEEDLASTRAKAKRPAQVKPPSEHGPRKKKTGLA